MYMILLLFVWKWESFEGLQQLASTEIKIMTTKNGKIQGLTFYIFDSSSDTRSLIRSSLS